MKDENRDIILDEVTAAYRKHDDYHSRFTLKALGRICDKHSDTRIFGGSVKEALNNPNLEHLLPDTVDVKSYKDAEPEVRLQLCYRLLTRSNAEAAEKTGKSPSTVGGHWETYGASFEADMSSIDDIHDEIASMKLLTDIEAT